MTFDLNRSESVNTEELSTESNDTKNDLPMKRISDSVVTILNYKQSKVSYVRVQGSILIYRICDDGVIVLGKLDASIKQSVNDNLSLRLLSSNFADNIRDELNDVICEECNWEKQDLNIQINIRPEIPTKILVNNMYFG